MKNEDHFSDSIQSSFDKLKKLQDSSALYQSITKLTNNVDPRNAFGIPDMEDLLEPPKLDMNLISPPVEKIKLPPIGEKLDQLCEFNNQLVATNKELLSHLEESNKTVSDLKQEQIKDKNSHKHDPFINAIIGFVGALIGAAAGVLFTILATRSGWL